MTEELKKRVHVHGVEVACPHCNGDRQHHGPIPYPHCIRCGGYGTIVLTKVEKNDD